jgi:hypothetical protein
MLGGKGFFYEVDTLVEHTMIHRTALNFAARLSARRSFRRLFIKRLTILDTTLHELRPRLNIGNRIGLLW